tara:strand:+ start:7556 stop:9874 length:2319 start_codon:yes stop_codon:yes gene_type:complete
MDESEQAREYSSYAFKVLFGIGLLVAAIVFTPLGGVFDAARASIITSVGTYIKANPYDTNLEDNLIFHLTFDGGDTDLSNSSAEFTDRGPNGQDADWVNYTSDQLVAGPLGQGVSFDGIDDYVNAGSDSSIDGAFTNNDDQATVALWVYVDDDDGDIETDQYIVNKKSSGGWRVYMNDSNDRLTFHIDTYGQDGIWSIAVPFQEWFHVSIAYDSSSSLNSPDFYLNGVLQEEALNNLRSSSPFPDSAGSLQLGKDANSASLYFKGAVDDLRIYDNYFTANDAALLYDSVSPSVISTTPEPDSTLSNGLVGHWTFDGPTMDYSDSTDVVIEDVSGNGNQASSSITTIVKSGILGQALNFEEDYPSERKVRIEPSPTIDNLSQISMSMWVKPDRDNYGDWNILAAKGNNTPSGYTDGWKFQLDGAAAGRPTFSVDYDTSNISKSSDETIENRQGEWIHLAFTWDGSDLASGINIYVDGILTGVQSDNDASGSRNTESTSQGLRLGTRTWVNVNTDNAWSGEMDDVRLYNRELTADEVTQLYNLGEPEVVATTITSGTLENGLVGHWTFDGNNVAWDDTSSEIKNIGSDGDQGNAISFGNESVRIGKIGQAIELDGTADYIDAGPVIDSDSWSEFTLSGWVYLNSKYDDQDIISQAITAGSNETAIRYDVGEDLWFFSVHDGSYKYAKYSQSSAQTEVWTHVVGVYDGSEIRVYVNGVEGSTAASVGTISANTGDTSIGKLTSWTRYVDGMLDDVRVYNRALSEAEIQRLYELGN